MQFGGILLAVKDIQAATAFYQELFDLKVACDYGRNQVFEGGLSLQEDFDWLTGVDKASMKHRAHNCEIFFEALDFDGFVEKLEARDDIEYLHGVHTHGWGQRVVRFYDLDGHLIEVGEAMQAVARRFVEAGRTVEEIAKAMDVRTADVWRMLEGPI